MFRKWVLVNLLLPTPPPIDPTKESKRSERGKPNLGFSMNQLGVPFHCLSKEAPRQNPTETPVRMCTGESCGTRPAWLFGVSVCDSQPA